jgi:hypothetical protein
MVEPDPVNVECIRRNFATEIASGKVVVAPEGAWSKPDVLRFSVGVANSGTGSFVLRESAKSIEVPGATFGRYSEFTWSAEREFHQDGH